jgi:hypothetical protein
MQMAQILEQARLGTGSSQELVFLRLR